VTVRSRPDLGSAEIEIRDEGSGVPNEEAERIFEPFYRADTSRTRNTGGTGLGLAIVAATVEAHRGTLGVRPNTPRGSCFWVRLPVRQTGGDVDSGLNGTDGPGHDTPVLETDVRAGNGALVRDAAI
jgi:signal transduction histidine kinase